MGLEEEVEYITDVNKIIEMGMMTSPVLAVDGVPVMTGYIDDIERIKELIKTANTTSQPDNN